MAFDMKQYNITIERLHEIDWLNVCSSQPTHRKENSPRMLVRLFVVFFLMRFPFRSVLLFHSFACFHGTTLLPMHINFAIENRQLKCTPAFINQMCTHETVQFKSRWQFEVHCINWHQYNTLAMYRMCSVHRLSTLVQCRSSNNFPTKHAQAHTHKFNTLYAPMCCGLAFFVLLLSLMSYSSIRPLRADRKLSIKCFIIMRCSLNFCPSPFGLRNYMLAVVLLVRCVSACVTRRAHLFLKATGKTLNSTIKPTMFISDLKG